MQGGSQLAGTGRAAGSGVDQIAGVGRATARTSTGQAALKGGGEVSRATSHVESI